SDLRELIIRNDKTSMAYLNRLIRKGTGARQGSEQAFLDMLTVVDKQGRVLYRAVNQAISGDNLLNDPVVRNCIKTKIPLSSTELMPIKNILIENHELSNRVKTDIIKTPQSADVREDSLADGMVMKVAYPIMDKNKNVLIGVLIAGVLINKDNEIVDKIKETVYHEEKYKGQEIGVATIFQGGVRISTNVMTKDNKRAIGTILSKEVYDRVIKEGKDWEGRAFVVKDWYISTYTPIYNMDKKLIGVLFTGVLESKYRDIQRQMIWLNLGITTMGMIIALIISLYFGNTIIKRIRILRRATEAIASGNLDYKLSPDNISGFNMLDEAFNEMAKSLKDRNDQLEKMHYQLAITERLTALGQMAAGVAHEINNPLGGILLYSSIMLEDVAQDSPFKENIQKIIYQTNRCKEIVQSLLDFARTPAGDMMLLQINDVINISLKLVKDQAMFHGIEIETNLAENLPEVKGDISRLEEVFLNLFINAADAMKGGGKLIITTRLIGKETVRIKITDTGKGIDEKHIPHIFEPFFTTKEPGQGTGLGLSIAYGIIRKHKGTIDVECRNGKGITFIICLPVSKNSNNSSDNDAISDSDK
ncbi:MAG: cache domain-containing protein, partial [Syntrophaceae bacterium]|nr:cache domain-containing protein [Syntrophaceae bacterium]